MKRAVTFSDQGIAAVSFTQDDPPARPSSQQADVAVAPARTWAGFYRVEVRGKSDEEIAASLDRIAEHHTAKCDRLNGFATLVQTAIVIGDVTYTWRDCTLREAGTGVELYLCVQDDARKWPMSRLYGSMADVPSDEAIVAIVTAAIEQQQQATAARAAQAARLRDLLGGG